MMDRNDKWAERVRSEQVKHLRDLSLWTLPCDLLIASALAVHLSLFVEARVVMAWWLAMAGVTALRFGLTWRAVALESWRRPRRSERLWVTGWSAGVGLLWGLPFLAFAPQLPNSHLIVYLLALTGVAGVAMPLAMLVWPAFLAGLVAMFAPVLLWMAIRWEFLGLLSATLALFLVAGMALAAWRCGQVLRQNISTRLTLDHMFRTLMKDYSLMSALSNVIPDPICFKNRRGVYLGCNKAFAQFVNRTEESLPGCSDGDIFSQEMADESARWDRQVVVARQPVSTEQWMPCPDGRQVLLDTLRIPFLGPDGQVLGVVSVSRDITMRKRIEDELRELAITDPLTNIPNRRHFMNEMRKEILRAQRYDNPLSVLMLDLDYFKRINDAHGHDVGDYTLQIMTRAALDTLRQTDILGRIGGEEFAALLPETTLETAMDIAERLRVALSQCQVPTIDASVQLTVSIGVSAYNGAPDETPQSMLKRADVALYAAKQRGRNRVEVG